LAATSELLLEVGLRAMTTDEIARRSGASKATIYKWWPNKYVVAIEAFLTEMFAESPDPDTGCAREDFRLALRGLMRFYTGPSGRVFAQLVGEAQFDPEVAAELRDRLVGSRRTLVRAIWELAAHPGAGDLGPRGHPRRAAPRHRSRGRDRPRFRAGDVPTGRRARAAGRRGRRRDRRRSPARPGPLTAELSD
jgi:AcrR family transcriptional regulator